ncbi:MAG: NAD(P)H-binding protein [Gemmatimonadaceae bacterium]
MSKTALILGATGLVGSECLRLFADSPDFARVIALTRRPLRADAHTSKVESHVVDFERLDGAAEHFRVSHVVCALGTTIKKAGSQMKFRRVDYDYPLAGAQLGVRGGARHFLLVSALGAKAQSRVFYSRVKGEIEEAIRALSYRAVTIVRPSILIGEREETRLGESIGKALARFAPLRYRPVAADDVAAAMLRAARDDQPGVRIIESNDLHHRA